MNVEMKTLSVARMREHGASLLEEHYQELTMFKEVVKLNVDWERYLKLESLGMLFSLGAWREGKLIGYSVFILQTNIHYKDLLYAANDVLFLRKDMRRGGVGIKLIKESETHLAELGVRKILWHCKFGTTLGSLLERMGYVAEEFTAAKIIRG